MANDFWRRLRQLGFNRYADYLASPHWLTFKARYRASGRPQRCAVCEDRNYQLHHKTYERLGEERLDDVVALCQEHHQMVHLWERAESGSARSVTGQAVAAMKVERKLTPALTVSDLAREAKELAKLAAECREWAGRGVRHERIPAGTQFDVTDPMLRAYHKWMKRAVRRGKAPGPKEG